MRVATRLIAFGGILGLTFSAAALVGASVKPAGEEPPEAADAHGGGHPEPAVARREGHGEGHAVGTGPAVGGIAVSQDGLTLGASSSPPGVPIASRFESSTHAGASCATSPSARCT